MKDLRPVLMILLLLISVPGDCLGKGGGSRSPAYFSFEDLRSAVKAENFYFQNDGQPGNAYVWLSNVLDYPLCASKNAVILKKAAASPSLYQFDPGAHILANWNDNVEVSVDWNSIAISAGRGDLIFTRSNSKAGNFVKYFSNWTHVAIVDDPWSKNVFESTPDNGVRVNNGPLTWKNITYYTCKTIETVPYSERCNLLTIGKSRYTNLPYYPREETTFGRAKWLYEWSNKDDPKSMYCSKLVYNVFRSCIDLDSGRTSVINPALQDKAWCAFMFSWIGVSPDDIYYSSSLGPDFTYSQNINYL